MSVRIALLSLLFAVSAVGARAHDLPRPRPRVEDPIWGHAHVGIRNSRHGIEGNRGAADSWVVANADCREAHVLEFAVGRGVPGIPAQRDYCRGPAESLPGELRAVLRRLKATHERYADAFGLPPGRLFGFGVRIGLGSHPAGPLKSMAGDRVEMAVFRDFRAEDWPEAIYAHELTHWLLLEGKLGAAAQALEPSYLFYESFPDLVASFVVDSPVIGFSAPGLRPALTFPRDGTPTRSMRRPFRDFFMGTFQDEAVDLCRAVRTERASRQAGFGAVTANEVRLCEYYARERREDSDLYLDSRTARPGAAALGAEFRADDCVIRYRDGTAGLDACNVFALGPVLVSFVRSLAPLLGPRPLAEFRAAIEGAAIRPDRMVCRFGPDAAGAVRLDEAEFEVPSLIAALERLREGLVPGGRVVFDAVWEAHGLEEWRALETRYRELEVAGRGYELLIAANPDYGRRHGCLAQTPAGRTPPCQARCEIRSDRI